MLVAQAPEECTDETTSRCSLAGHRQFLHFCESQKARSEVPPSDAMREESVGVRRLGAVTVCLDLADCDVGRIILPVARETEVFGRCAGLEQTLAASRLT